MAIILITMIPYVTPTEIFSLESVKSVLFHFQTDQFMDHKLTR